MKENIGTNQDFTCSHEEPRAKIQHHYMFMNNLVQYWLVPF